MFPQESLSGVIAVVVVVAEATLWSLTYGGPLSQLQDNDGVS